MLSGPLDRAPLPNDLQVLLESSSPTLPTGALPSDPLAFVNRGPASGA